MTKLLTEEEVAQVLGVSRSTVRRLVTRAQLPYVDLSATASVGHGPKNRRYPEDHLRSWIVDRVRVQESATTPQEPEPDQPVIIPRKKRRILK